MTDSKNIVEITTRLVLPQNEIDQFSKEQNKELEKKFIVPKEYANRELASSVETTFKERIKEDNGVLDKSGSFVKFCENNSMFLFGTTIVLGLVNFALILLCLVGIPSMPYISISKGSFSLPKIKLPNMSLPDMGFKINEMNFDACSILAIASSSIFFAIPAVLHKYVIGHKIVRKENRQGYGNDGRLTEFVCKHPKLVFWTGYLLTFVNIALLAGCYCGLPQLRVPAIALPSLPKLQFSMPSLPKGSLFTMGINFVGLSINPCITMTIIALLSFLIVFPFLFLCPLSPFYEEMKFKRAVVTSEEKENLNDDKVDKYGRKNGQLVQFVLQYPQLTFWTGYSLTCLNVILMLACFCGVPAVDLLN